MSAMLRQNVGSVTLHFRLVWSYLEPAAVRAMMLTSFKLALLSPAVQACAGIYSASAPHGKIQVLPLLANKTHLLQFSSIYLHTRPHKTLKDTTFHTEDETFLCDYACLALHVRSVRLFFELENLR